MARPLVYISFAPGDELWADRVRNSLLSIGHQERLECWDPRDTVTGQDEEVAIEAAIERANLSVLLLSIGFFNCDRVKRLDVPKLVARREAVEEFAVIPLLVRPCPWKTVHWLHKIQMYPADAHALSSGHDHQIDEDLTELAYRVNDLLP